MGLTTYVLSWHGRCCAKKKTPHRPSEHEEVRGIQLMAARAIFIANELRVNVYASRAGEKNRLAGMVSPGQNRLSLYSKYPTGSRLVGHSMTKHVYPSEKEKAAAAAMGGVS